jgi:hypothetical protein
MSTAAGNARAVHVEIMAIDELGSPRASTIAEPEFCLRSANH